MADFKPYHSRIKAPAGEYRFELEFWTRERQKCYLEENPGPVRFRQGYSYITISEHFVIK
jgi:hypothetical protein